MPDSDRKLRVFICHALDDKSVVHGLYQRFLDEGWIEPWLDELNLLPGQDRGLEIDKVLESTDVALICLSKQSLDQDGNIQREIRSIVNFAKEKPENSIFVIPVCLDDCEIPRVLGSIYPVYLTKVDDKEKAYIQILRSMEMKFELISGKTGKSRWAHWASSSTSEVVSDLANLTFGGFNFVKIPKGKFIMGSRASNKLSGDNEHPQRPYEIPYNYWITYFPVSYEQFSEYAVSTRHFELLPKDWMGRLNKPVTNVTWNEVLEYTKWLNKIFKKEISNKLVFRLPTEAEWERSSRGDLGWEWPWGNENLDNYLDSGKPELLAKLMKKKHLDEKKFSNTFGEYFVNTSKVNSSGIRNDPEKSELDSLKVSLDELRKRMELADIGTFSPVTDSPFDIADMMGPVWEWTHSLYKPYPYELGDGRENLEDSGERVIRGSFMTRSERFSVRSAKRGHALPDIKESFLGFRIVVAPQVS